MPAIPCNTPEQAALAREYEAARNAYGRAQALGTGGAVRRDGDVEVWSGPFMHPYHGWMSASVPAAQVRDALTTALRLYRPFGTSMFVPVGPAARDESEMRAALRERKFRCSYHVPVMHLDLRRWTPPRATVDFARVELVRDWDVLRDRSRDEGGWGTTALTRRRWEFRRHEATAENPRWWQWLAWQRERVVGNVALFRHGETVLVLDLHVVPERRRRGLGAALMTAACRHAQELGARAAVLSASSSGVGLYQKLGFTDAGRWSDFLLSGEAIAKLRI